MLAVVSEQLCAPASAPKLVPELAAAVVFAHELFTHPAGGNAFSKSS